MDTLLEAAYSIQQRRTDGRSDGPCLAIVEPPMKQRSVNDKTVWTREETENRAGLST
jgi:hypothetical protein